MTREQKFSTNSKEKTFVPLYRLKDDVFITQINIKQISDITITENQGIDVKKLMNIKQDLHTYPLHLIHSCTSKDSMFSLYVLRNRSSV